MSWAPSGDNRIGLAAGDGLGASTALIEGLLRPVLGLRGSREDGARLRPTGGESVMTADVFAVEPIVFPGGNIGTLAASGLCNDLLASGALITDVALGIFASAELESDVLSLCLSSFAELVSAQGASVVCGDTKVNQDLRPELVLFATAIGAALSSRQYDLADARAGDDLIVSGPLGDHAIAVLSQREGLGFDAVVRSDARPLNDPIVSLIEDDLVHSLRDLTRGGLVAALWDGYEATRLRWMVRETYLPVREPVRAAAEMLGLDVLTLTNEGCMLLASDPANRHAVLDRLGAAEATAEARVVGTISEDVGVPGPVIEEIGGRLRPLPLPHGIGVPRLC